MTTIVKFLGSTITYLAAIGSFVFYALKKFWKLLLIAGLVILFIFTFGRVNKLGKRQSC
ncbi:MAG: hypothetical protein K6E87_03040 [bacterium]|nr:hypothetical protein [bacterium]